MRRRLAGATALALLLVSVLPHGVARAAEYEMQTVAHYAVDPDARQIAVSVEVTFTNTLPNPPGQISAFDRIEMAIHDGASQVAASDSAGPLHVDLVTRDGLQVASVRPRSQVRYNKEVSFTLTYLLADAGQPDVHVRPGIVKFPAWGFGTSSEVLVDLPASYEAHADGDPMLTAEAGTGQELSSGPIADPDRWLSLITAVLPAEFVTQSASVALSSGTVDLQVRAWNTDPTWGDRTLALLVAALPMLEEAIGLPYPRVGPLVVSEAAGGEESADAPLSASAEIQVAFDEAPFTVLHQAAHVWIDERLAADRWIQEGLASHYAARVAPPLDVALPYDPAARTAELAADARPLVAWGAAGGAPTADAYGYAASWALIDRIATTIGEGRLALALQRVVAGVTAYDSVDPEGSLGENRFAPVDTRRLLDQLSAVDPADLSDLFGDVVFGADAAPELQQRNVARTAYLRLLAAAGDWGAPDPVRSAMTEWQFDRARAAVDDASAWLVTRDALMGRIARAELVTPERLRARYMVSGGGADAVAELEAERGIVERYLLLGGRLSAPHGPLEAIGLFAAGDPKEMLAEAASEFNDGDLQSAAASLDKLELRLGRATSDGIVRLASGAVLLVIVALGVGLLRRRRAGSHYTAAP